MAYTEIESSNGRKCYPVALKCEYLVDGPADLAALPDDSSPGSIAYTADMKSMWMKGNDGTWTRIGA